MANGQVPNHWIIGDRNTIMPFNNDIFIVGDRNIFAGGSSYSNVFGVSNSIFASYSNVFGSRNYIGPTGYGSFIVGNGYNINNPYTITLSSDGGTINLINGTTSIVINPTNININGQIFSPGVTPSLQEVTAVGNITNADLIIATGSYVRNNTGNESILFTGGINGQSTTLINFAATIGLTQSFLTLDQISSLLSYTNGTMQSKLVLNGNIAQLYSDDGGGSFSSLSLLPDSFSFSSDQGILFDFGYPAINLKQGTTIQGRNPAVEGAQITFGGGTWLFMSGGESFPSTIQLTDINFRIQRPDILIVGDNAGPGAELDVTIGGSNESTLHMGSDSLIRIKTDNATTTNELLLGNFGLGAEINSFDDTPGNNSQLLVAPAVVQINNTDGLLNSQFQATPHGMNMTIPSQGADGSSTGIVMQGPSTNKLIWDFITLTTTNASTSTDHIDFLGYNTLAIECNVTGYDTGNDLSYGATLFAVFKKSAGTVTQISTTTKDEKSEFTTSTTDLNTNGTIVRISATGEASTSITWRFSYKIHNQN